MNQDAILKRTTLYVAAMAAFLTPFMGSAINLAIPSIGHEFNSTAFMLSWVATGYILASAAFLLPVGRLADIVGRKRIFVFGISGFVITSILCGLAWSIQALIAFRALQGIASAMIFGTSMAMLTSVFPPQERGKVLGINVASVYIGLSLGPVLGGMLNYNLGWQSIFYLTALIALLAVILTVTRLKVDWAGAKGEQYDFTGAILYTPGLLFLMYGISSIAELDWAKYLLGLGLAMLVVFVVYETKIKYPLLNVKLLGRNVTFAFSNLAALINYSATFGVSFLMSLYLQVVMGFNSQAAGLVMLSQPVIMALLSPFAGNISDRVQPRIVASLGMGLTTLAIFIFCFLSANTPLWLIIINLIILGAGFGLFSSPNTNAVMGSVEKRFYGVASSTIGTMRLVGQAISMAIVTLLITFYVGSVEFSQASPELLIKGTRIAFIVFTVFCFGGVFASLARGNVGRGSAGETEGAR